jgi:hypothetical protein
MKPSSKYNFTTEITETTEKNLLKNNKTLCALWLVLLSALCAPPLMAQESPHFQIKTKDLNAGGNPSNGVAITSTNFKFTVDSLGDCLAGTGVKSTHFRFDAGFPPTTANPGIPGDCDGDGSVSIGEVQKAINMFLGTLAPGCGVDCNGDGTVSIGEVQKVINGFLGVASSC